MENARKDFGQGKVYDLGRHTTIVDQVQRYFDNCRIKVNEIKDAGRVRIMEQSLLSWNEGHNAVCCQNDVEVEESHITENGGNVACGTANVANVAQKCQQRWHNDNNIKEMSSDALVKLTLIDRRKVMIGTTELNLLRRQEVFEGHGVTVSGANIQFSLSKKMVLKMHLVYLDTIYTVHKV